jgi:hypothetical protein
VQTFVPFASFEASARALDVRRLGKQRVEVIQVVRALVRPDYAWKSHPAVLMWAGYEEALGRYGLTMCEVWQAQGFEDTCASTIRADLAAAGIDEIRPYDVLLAEGALPRWLFDRDVQLSHRSSLVHKDPEHYRPQFPGVPDDLPYVWPVRSQAVLERERRRAENAEMRRRRAVERELEEAARSEAAAHRRRSAAARRGWRTRALRARRGSGSDDRDA